MVRVAQLVRALDCGSRGRGFKSRLSPFLGGMVLGEALKRTVAEMGRGLNYFLLGESGLYLLVIKSEPMPSSKKVAGSGTTAVIEQSY